eukprot:COSAG05_NODE_23477_length_258_cov_0.327044_1_plen_41_part_10
MRTRRAADQCTAATCADGYHTYDPSSGTCSACNLFNVRSAQ